MQIHVVHESRFYSSWSSEDSVKAGVVSKKSGIISAKKVLNKLHMKLGQEGFSEVCIVFITKFPHVLCHRTCAYPNYCIPFCICN